MYEYGLNFMTQGTKDFSHVSLLVVLYNYRIVGVPNFDP